MKTATYGGYFLQGITTFVFSLEPFIPLRRRRFPSPCIVYPLTSCSTRNKDSWSVILQTSKFCVFQPEKVDPNGSHEDTGNSEIFSFNDTNSRGILTICTFCIVRLVQCTLEDQNICTNLIFFLFTYFLSFSDVVLSNRFTWVDQNVV